MGAVLGIVISIAGALMVVGGIKDWPFLTDPPKALAFVYSQALLRLMLSRQSMRIATAGIGMIMLLAGFGLLFGE